VIEGFGKQELQSFVLGAVAPQTPLVTDNWPSYRDLPGVRHNPITLGPMAAHVALPWIHRRFSNLKRWGLGEFSGVTVQGKDMLLTGFRREAIHYNLFKKHLERWFETMHFRQMVP
jgi:hypothetical protein